MKTANKKSGKVEKMKSFKTFKSLKNFPTLLLSNFPTFLTFITLLLFTTSCHVHEWPKGDVTQLVVNLNFDTEFKYITYSLDEDKQEINTGFYNPDFDHGVISYTIRLFPIVNGKVNPDNYKEYTLMRNIVEGYNCSVPVDVDEGDYRVMVWAMLAESANGPFYYDASNFWEIKLQGEYSGDNNYRDAFRGMKDVSVGEEFTTTIEMTRPLAKYEFITSDVPDFLTKEARRTNRSESDTRVSLSKYDVVFSYIGYMPSAYNLPEDKTVDSLTGVQFHSTVTQISESEATLGFDYVFVNNSGTHVTLQIALYDTETGEQVSNSDKVRIPLQRSYDTLVYGTFLYQNADSGIGIDPGYVGDFNIFYDN